ncbi:MAG: VTT domain-containing protein [Deltaproteobacteria bacterium]
MPSHDMALSLIETYGLWILVPFAIFEGPIATVIAAYLAQLGFMNVFAVYVVCVAGDLIGDALLYATGRFGTGLLPLRVSRWLGMTQARQLALSQHFDAKGGRTLLFGKWTHSAGMPILVASGVARMNFSKYLSFNLLGTLPKTLLFVLLGYFLGAAYSSIDSYIYRGSQALLIAALVAGGAYLLWQRRRA